MKAANKHKIDTLNIELEKNIDILSEGPVKTKKLNDMLKKEEEKEKEVTRLLNIKKAKKNKNEMVEEMK